jgi:4-alpha-glucanotransferase
MNSMRESGVLLPITALPSSHGIGDLGPAAMDFIDLLGEARQKVWQILPIHPSGPDGSPYFSDSSFAGNWQLISPEALAAEDLISQTHCLASAMPVLSVNPEEAAFVRHYLLNEAVDQLFKTGFREEIDAFTHEHAAWLPDYALFTVLKGRNPGTPWTMWEYGLRTREAVAIREAEKRYADHMERVCAVQWLFMQQWEAVRSHARSQRIEILGDLPIYTTHDSADVWAHPQLFSLDADGTPSEGAGVPPDYFSSTGQLWGNPLYRWEAHEEDGFSWWLSRMERALSLYDRVRIDHFRGLSAYWAVPARQTTAEEGHWVPGPGTAFIRAIRRRFPSANLIAEDLGVIDASVRTLMQMGGIPGMRVILFAFSGDTKNPHLPYNHPPDAYVYTGTHDNPPVRGWFLDDATRGEREYLNRYLGREVDVDEVPDIFIRLAFSSVARHVITPLQDLIGLGSEARINRPGTTGDNWRWRLSKNWPSVEVASRLRLYTETYGRTL